MSIKAVRGTYDIFGSDIKRLQIFESKIRDVLEQFNYHEIRTPIFESTELFKRSIGEATDIVEKEMYTIPREKDSGITLRPEATAAVVRAYLEHRLYDLGYIQRLYYMGPMFRHERPQAGRLRQFHQFGIETLGCVHPTIDAEVIRVLMCLLKALGVKGASLRINSIGSLEFQRQYSEFLRAALKDKIKDLDEDSQKRYERNVFRLLDSKNEACQKTIRELPTLNDKLDQVDREHFEQVRAYLDSYNISYNIDPYLVRGLDYYTGTVFEVNHPSLGAQDAIAAGGRYDYLIKQLGGPSLGATGFAAGIERLLMVIENPEAVEKPFDIFLVSMGDESFKKNWDLREALREMEIHSELDYDAKSLRAQLRQANRLGVRFVLMRGEEELKKGIVKVKDMQSDQEDVDLDESEIIQYIKEKMRE